MRFNHKEVTVLRHFPRIFLPVIISILILVVLTACGGGNEVPTPTAEPAATNTVAPTAASATNTPEATDTAEALEESAQEATAASQPDSPLDTPAQPDSPLAAPQPDSPLAVPAQPTVFVAMNGRAQIEALADQTVAEDPSPDKGSISGLLYSYTNDQVIPKTVFYLTLAPEENGQTFIPSIFVGAVEEKGDITGISNLTGQFYLNDVPPGKYYLVVWTVYDWLLAFGAEEDDQPLLIEVKPDEKLDLGLLYLDWP